MPPTPNRPQRRFLALPLTDSAEPLRLSVMPWGELGLGFVLTLLFAWGFSAQARLPASYTILAAGLYGLLAVILCIGWAKGFEGARYRGGFGWANRVTLLRGLVLVLIGALIPFPEVAARHGWALAWLSLGALILDGVDGTVARKTGSSSAFGSRFDMELDAAFILALALLLVSMGKAGVWITALGLIRYGFVVAMRFWPWMQRPLPESFRRKTVCVWQVATLVICLLPTVSPGFAILSLGFALGLLIYSFAIDLYWLARHRTNSPTLQAGDL